jgi:uncharacterized membrane protein YfhO
LSLCEYYHSPCRIPCQDATVRYIVDHLLIYIYISLALALRQISIKIIALQWIFAFVIFAVFLVVSLYISTTKYTGRDSLFRRVAQPESTDRERAPLLNEQV